MMCVYVHLKINCKCMLDKCLIGIIGCRLLPFHVHKNRRSREPRRSHPPRLLYCFTIDTALHFAVHALPQTQHCISLYRNRKGKTLEEVYSGLLCHKLYFFESLAKTLRALKAMLCRSNSLFIPWKRKQRCSFFYCVVVVL